MKGRLWLKLLEIESSIMELADKKACTGCGACAYVCPKGCIAFKADKTYDIAYPIIDNKKCISCGKCSNICPALHPVDKHEPLHAYAAWSSDEEERRTSASGGIAAEIYKFAIDKGWCIVGAAFQKNFEVWLKLSDNLDSIKEFKNSKYVFSSAAHLYKEINAKLKSGKKIVVIALPCQIAAFKKVFHKYLNNLLLVDLVCHGTTPSIYLEQYIRYMEAKYNKSVGNILFRDPRIGTQRFVLSLYDINGQCFYSDSAIETKDIYQCGYHKMVTYRENCYHCPYANRFRISDITLSDYKGLGNMAPCSFNEEKVSCVLLNSEKGKRIMGALIETGKIIAEARPIEEPIKGDEQLQHPSNKTYARYLFERKYVQRGDFVPVMINVYTLSKVRERLLWCCRLPFRIVNKIYRIFHLL